MKIRFFGFNPTSFENDLTVYDVHDAEKSRLPDASPELSEHEAEDAVCIGQTTSDIQEPDCTANEVEKPDGEIQQHNSPVDVFPTLDQPQKYGQPNISKLTPSPPPPPPIDVIAIDVKGQRPSADLPCDDDDERSDSEGEYRHSPLGGAMPESDDSSVGEFAFP